MYSCYCFILNFVRVHKDDKEDMEMADTIKVTLVKSPIGAKSGIQPIHKDFKRVDAGNSRR